jgi:hypothetical protein
VVGDGIAARDGAGDPARQLQAAVAERRRGTRVVLGERRVEVVGPADQVVGEVAGEPEVVGVGVVLAASGRLTQSG